MIRRATTPLEAYVRHARMFGAEGVLEAAGRALSPVDLEALRVALDRLDAADRSRKRRRSSRLASGRRVPELRGGARPAGRGEAGPRLSSSRSRSAP